MGSEIVSKTRARSAMLITRAGDNLNPPSYFQYVGRRLGASVAVQDGIEDEVLFLPPLGTRLFWVGYRPFLFSRTGGQSHQKSSTTSGILVNDHGQLQQSLIITTLGWDLAPIRAFTNMCHEFKLKNSTGTTTVYFAGSSGDGWQSVSKATRKLDTIDMDEHVKADLIRDADYYYSEQSRQYFADCGIPYRRGYLFWGPPGTGKSSFSAALAGHLQCDIYQINLSTGNIDDNGLLRLFLNLPRKCVVVMEDVDSAGIGREQRLPPPSTVKLPRNLPREVPDPLSTEDRMRNTLTLSGLLNAIDGNASQEGRLLIMTSNNPDVLDAALTRPGRIDKKVYFGRVSEAAGKSIFMRLIGRSALVHNSAYSMDEIEQHAKAFMEKIPPNTFTPAQIQNFLQGCRGDPLVALGDIEGWVEENRETNNTKRTEGSKSSASSVSVAAGET